MHRKQILVFISVSILAAALLIRYISNINSIEALKLHSSVHIVDRHNQPLFQSRTQSGDIQSWILLENVPQSFIDLLMLSEDKRFYSHPGIDPIAVVRAFFLNMKHKKIVSGGSTITQQLVKIQRKNQRQTLSRKATEALWAVAFELRYSKDEILEAYINTVYLGHSRAGFAAASLYYFDTPLSALSLSEFSQLICLLRSPYFLDPFRYPDRLKKFSNQLLLSAVQNNIISQEDYKRALETTLSYTQHSFDRTAEHFTRFLLNQLPATKQVGTIQTSLDINLQNEVKSIVNEELEKLSNRNVSNASCLVVDVKTGEVLVYLGSKKFYDLKSQGQVDGIQALRQPGSTLKPFAYEMAFERGFAPNTMIPDLPTEFPGQSGLYIPQNYSQSFTGMVPIRTALANSLNIPALFIAQKMGIASLTNRFRKLGLKSLDKNPDYYGLGIVLGNGEVSLWELTQAYLVLAKNGTYIPLALQKQPQQPYESKIVLDERTTYLITDILSDNKAREQSFGLSSPLSQDFQAAAKTGTSTNYRDNWTIGYTPDYLVGVWVGNFDGSPMQNVSGITGAGTIWKRVMKKVVGEKKSYFKQPEGIISRRICTQTHLIASSHCNALTTEKLTSEMLRNQTICTLKDHAVSAQEKYEKNRIPKNEHLQIVFPKHNTYFAIDPKVDITRQIVDIDFVAEAGIKNISFSVDGKTISSSRWQITKGPHKITVSGQLKNKTVKDTVFITVL